MPHAIRAVHAAVHVSVNPGLDRVFERDAKADCHGGNSDVDH